MSEVSLSENSEAANAAATLRASRTHALLTAPIGPTLLKLAAPNVLAMFVQSAQSVAEAYYASVLGVTALAGLALVFPFVMLTQMLSAGAIGGAVSAAIARALGASQQQRAATLALTARPPGCAAGCPAWAPCATDACGVAAPPSSNARSRPACPSWTASPPSPPSKARPSGNGCGWWC